MLLKDWRGGTIYIPANQHVDSLRDLRASIFLCSQLILKVAVLVPHMCQLSAYCLYSLDVCVFLTGPMLIHLVNWSSAWMCSYSSLTALPLSVVLWWASYTFNTTAGQKKHSRSVNGVYQFFHGICKY